jgi:site-specific DNA recombinase
MRAAAAKVFDVVVTEDMDRIFRDQADYHAARKELDFLGITIHSATGKVTKIDPAPTAGRSTATPLKRPYSRD